MIAAVPFSAKKRRVARSLAAALSAVTLLVAPVAAAVRVECDLCPRDCPMHAAPEKASKLGCHGTTKTPEHRGGVRLTRPPCRDHAGMTGGIAQQPMLRPAPSATQAIRGASMITACIPERASGALPQPEPPPPRRAR